MSTWRDMSCEICLTSCYRSCGHWPGWPKTRPANDVLEEIYRRWARPAKPPQPKPVAIERPIPVPRTPAVSHTTVVMVVSPEVREFLANAGRLGGLSRSERKVAASRRNAKLGGRLRAVQARNSLI